MKATAKKKPPQYTVFIVEGDGDAAFWRKIGGAWAHKDGRGFSIQMNVIAFKGRLVLRKPKPKSKEQNVT